eukprot:scaffold2155_cov260-Pinguiococcus_pyrenoidosus.AAC.2
MAAAHTSYEGVPCEQHEECLRGSYCDVDEDLGTCRSCVKKRMNAYDFYVLFDEIFHSDVIPRPVFDNGTLVNDDKFEYLCPEYVPLSECIDRCENPEERCISSQYLSYFSGDEPATIVVAVFVIVFFAVLARQQQTQTLLSFFYMRHEIQYKPLRELSKRMKRTRRAYKKQHGKLTPSRERLMKAKSAHAPNRATALSEQKESATLNGTDVETGKDTDSVISDDGILADLVDPVGDDDASFESQGTVEAKYDEWKLRISTYWGAVSQMMLQQLAGTPRRLMDVFAGRFNTALTPERLNSAAHANRALHRAHLLADGGVGQHGSDHVHQRHDPGLPRQQPGRALRTRLGRGRAEWEAPHILAFDHEADGPGSPTNDPFARSLK